MPQGDLVVRVIGDLTKFKADLNKAVTDIRAKVQVGMDNSGGRDDITIKALKSIEKDKERAEIDARKREIKGENKLTDLAGSIKGGFTKILAPLAVISILAQGMRSLINQVMIVGRLISFIIKPIGDILSVGLMPLIGILKPIGMFFNTIMKPYIQKAREAMRLGASLQKEGDTTGAMKMYVLGAEYIMTSFLDVGLSTVAELSKMFIGLFESLGKAMSEFQGGGILGDIIRGIGSSIVTGAEMAKSGIDDIKNTVMGFITNNLDSQLAGAIMEIGEKTGKSASRVYASMTQLGLSTQTITDAIDKKLISTSDNSNTIMGTFYSNTVGWIQKLKDQSDIILMGYSKYFTPFEGAYIDKAAMQSVTSTTALARGGEYSKASTVNQNTYHISNTVTIPTNGKVDPQEVKSLFEQNAEDFYRKALERT
jgi:hypothetical protein